MAREVARLLAHNRKSEGNCSTLEDAIASFALIYGDQNEQDYQSLLKAIRDGRIEAF